MSIWSFVPFNIKSTDIIPTLLSMPGVLVKEFGQANDIEWSAINKGITTAINDLVRFRLDEGKKLEDDIQLRILNVDKLLNEISPFEKARIEKEKQVI